MKPDQEPRKNWLDPDIVESLDEAMAPHGGDEELLARVRAKVMAVARSESSASHRTVRAPEGEWERIAPDVARKTLWVSGGTRSCLMRLDPGAVVSAHIHPADEECIILEGSIRIGDLVLCTGDFHIGLKGSSHDVTTSDTGALVYLRSAVEEV